MEETKVYSNGELADQIVEKTIEEVVAALRARGYDPINQIVGYIISGDPGYISNYENARSKMLELDRSELVALLLKNTLEK